MTIEIGTVRAASGIEMQIATNLTGYINLS